jgi:ribosomal subunit interface protein
MPKRITFRGMEHSPVIEEYCNGQLAKVEEFLTHEREPIYINLVLDAQRTHAHHHVELCIKTPNYDLVSHYEGPEMYDVIDRVIDTMYRQLTEAKKKNMIDGRHADSYKGA